ncbi:MAG: hypothetical protein ACK53Q_14010 [Dolichospermum sp.]|jgi:predicted RNase H-like nuclease (RuvC/YqgF family)
MLKTKEAFLKTLKEENNSLKEEIKVKDEEKIKLEQKVKNIELVKDGLEEEKKNIQIKLS